MVQNAAENLSQMWINSSETTSTFFKMFKQITRNDVFFGISSIYLQCENPFISILKQIK